MKWNYPIIGLNGRVDDGFLKIPLPPEREGAAINFVSGDVPPEKVGASAAVAADEQEPNTLIFLHTGVCEAEQHTVKDATVFEEEDIEECDKCVKASYNI